MCRASRVKNINNISVRVKGGIAMLKYIRQEHVRWLSCVLLLIGYGCGGGGEDSSTVSGNESSICTVSGRPSINQVAGIFSNGQTITITGTGFGSCGPTVVLFDDFEKGIEGSNISTSLNSAVVKQWSAVSTDYQPVYSTLQSHSGIKSMLIDYAQQGRWAEVQFSGTNCVYFSFWMLVPSDSCVPGVYNQDGPNWKFVLLSGNPWPASDFTSVFLQDLPNPAFSLMSAWYDSAGLYNGSDTATSMIKGRWHRFEWSFYGHTSAGFIHGWEMNDGSPRRQIQNATGISSLHANDLWGLVRFPAYARQDNVAKNYYDDIYVAIGAGAQARVEIGNNADYSDCTALAILTTRSWSDTLIRADVRHGSFDVNDNVYLFVVDASGAASPGFALTLGHTY